MKRSYYIVIITICFLFSVATAAAPFSAEVVRYNLKYRVEIPSVPKNVKRLRIWIPYPLEGPHQKVVHSEVKTPLSWHLESEKRYGNRYLFIEGQSGPAYVDLNLEVERKIDRGLALDKIQPNTIFDPERYLGPTPRIPFTKQIQKIAKEETDGLKKPFQKIRALYEYIYNTMIYNKEGEGWGNGDPIWACANKRGNCTDFHSLFIALARTQDIPARFEIGIPIPHKKSKGEIKGYHCWAQVFDTENGWVPLDASESKKLGKIDAYFKKLPPDRILFSAGRNIVLTPPQAGEPLNYFFYPYAEADGKKIELEPITFHFKKLETKK